LFAFGTLCSDTNKDNFQPEITIKYILFISKNGFYFVKNQTIFFNKNMLKNATVLVVDDDQDVLLAIKLLLRPIVKEVIIEKNPERIQSLINAQKFDLVLLDMNYNSSLNTGNEGIFWLRKIRQIDANVPIIMITAYGDIDLAVKSVKEGANDFLLKPWQNEKLIDTIDFTLNSDPKVSNVTEKRKSLPNNQLKQTMIGSSEIMNEILYKVEKIAPTDANILILGENGTGKGELAKYIHSKSHRINGPFVHADLGSLTESLFESELFGHKKGAFTDAREDRIGRFESAEKGTLFLDEIGNISLAQQYKLLTVLQERKITRLGTNAQVPIDIRLISATNAPIYEMANQNTFRKDLVYRLNTIEITIPALRERGNDILQLAQFFAKNYADRYHKLSMEIDAKAAAKLLKYNYPGNVRELQHTIERAVIMAENDIILEKDISFSNLEKAPSTAFNTTATLNLGEVEKLAIEKVIEKHNGNITKAAMELGITRSALYRRLGKYDI
jgi:two-component system, NtrC family, response regulator HydG